MDWYTYILECADGTLYTGITTDIQKRLKTHNLGKASKYTRSRLPVTLKWCENQVNESAARKREAEIKQLTRHKKLALFQTK